MYIEEDLSVGFIWIRYIRKFAAQRSIQNRLGLQSGVVIPVPSSITLQLGSTELKESKNSDRGIGRNADLL